MDTIVVGMADLNVTRSPGKLMTLGLGSCVGVIIYDQMNKVGGMAHVMLPSCPPGSDPKNKAKFADTAIDELTRSIIALGAKKSNLKAKLAGGAHMFSTSSQTDIMQIGARNVDMCRKLLTSSGIPLVSEDTGGTCGRTITFDVNTCSLQVRSIWPEIREKDI